MTRYTNRPLPPLPPSEPLDEEERGLARALRELPSTMPPPELDARILGASRRAIAAAPKPRAHRRGWVWGLSTAAAAVLAVGVLLKMHLQGRDQAVAPPSEAPAAAQSAAAKSTATPAAINAEDTNTASTATADAGLAQSTADSELKQVQARAPNAELAKSERDEMKSAKPAASPASASGTVAQMNAANSGAGQPAGGRAAANAAPQPFPATTVAPPPATQAAPPEREAAGGFAKPSTADQPGYLSTPAPPPPASAATSQPRQTPVPPPSEPAQIQESQDAGTTRKDKAQDRVELTGSRTKRAAEAALPALEDDTTLSPGQWLGRIRARVDAGDNAGARESLHRYIAHYPDAWVPPDLAPLNK